MGKSLKLRSAVSQFLPEEFYMFFFFWQVIVVDTSHAVWNGNSTRAPSKRILVNGRKKMKKTTRDCANVAYIL